MSHNNYTRPRTLYTIFVYFFKEGCTCHVESAVRVHQTVFWDGGPIIWQEIEKARQKQLRKDLIDKYKIQRELNKVNMKRMFSPVKEFRTRLHGLKIRSWPFDTKNACSSHLSHGNQSIVGIIYSTSTLWNPILKYFNLPHSSKESKYAICLTSPHIITLLSRDLIWWTFTTIPLSLIIPLLS